MRIEVYRRKSLRQRFVRFLRRTGALMICATDERIVIEVPGVGKFVRADKIGRVI